MLQNKLRVFFAARFIVPLDLLFLFLPFSLLSPFSITQSSFQFCLSELYRYTSVPKGYPFQRFSTSSFSSGCQFQETESTTKRRTRDKKQTVSNLYSFFLHYINIWDQKAQNSVFYDAFLPTTWIKPAKYSKRLGSDVPRDNTSDGLPVAEC